jgi:hypothetical protein
MTSPLKDPCGLPPRVKPATERIDAILDELMITSELDPLAKTELYMKLLKETAPLFTREEELECWTQWNAIHANAVKLAQGQQSQFTELSIEFESVIRRRIKEKHGGTNT